tara:strand:- start:225 stop:752 length:528 start_codon:yes stop_codon:yes gene_type:complete
MKHFFLKILIVLIYLIASSHTYSIAETNIKNLLINKNQKKVGDIEFFNSKNELLSIKDFNSKVLLVNFWATWCAPCKEEIPSLSSLKKKNLKNFKIILINIGDEDFELTQNFFKELNIKNLNSHFAESGKIAKHFRLRGIPTSIFINKKGYEFARIIGSIDFENEEFLNWLKNNI